MPNRIVNFDNPFVSGELIGNIDFNRLGKEFLSSNIIDINGDFLSNISYAFNLNDLKKYRSIYSHTPGHPEYNLDKKIKIRRKHHA